jgi:hypothetical protein
MIAMLPRATWEMEMEMEIDELEPHPKAEPMPDARFAAIAMELEMDDE